MTLFFGETYRGVDLVSQGERNHNFRGIRKNSRSEGIMEYRSEQKGAIKIYRSIRGLSLLNMG